MHCSSRPAHLPTLPLTPPAPAPDARVGDADRQVAADLLADAAAQGYLTLDELDDRLAATWAASTGADLAAATADLPVALRRERARREAAERARAAARAALRPHLASYASVMLLLVTIWLAIGLSGGGWYPWPIWPALGWGIGVASHARAARQPGPA